MVMPQGRAGMGGRGRGRGNPRPQIPLNDRIVNVPKSSIRKVQSIEGIDLTNKVVSCALLTFTRLSFFHKWRDPVPHSISNKLMDHIISSRRQKWPVKQLLRLSKFLAVY